MQNLAAGGIDEPHEGQEPESGVPHSEQNLLPSRFSALQFEQFNAAPPLQSPARYRLGGGRSGAPIARTRSGQVPVDVFQDVRVAISSMNLVTSTLPPLRITPTRSPRPATLPASNAASPLAPLGSTTSFSRSKARPIA